MKIEDQVVSLELAKRLKELGVKQESYFYWWDGYHYGYHRKQGWLPLPAERTEVGLGFPDRTLFWDKNCSAFTVAELGEMLRGNGMGTTAFSCMTAKWWVTGGEWTVEKQRYAHTIEDTKEADARAKMLIYLLENKLVKP